ncbi:MAG: site-2 protease family protein, partial [Acidobacteria bacterium]|nr:site-2 protease family protein [Acidobacteriota bacterium]
MDIPSLLLAFAVVLASLTVHEWAHAWTADRLGDPTARMLGRVSFNPLVHIDVLGTIVLPLISVFSGFPILGWAKPVPVNVSRL